jgi:hypothetical protein
MDNNKPNTFSSRIVKPLKSENPALLKEIATELLTLARELHKDLLHRFARVAPNQLRPEIAFFREMLRALIAWAENSPELEELSYSAVWWESYWYEKEYGDSEFNEPSQEDHLKQKNLRSAFFWNYMALWVPTIDMQMLAEEMAAAATSTNPTINSLSVLAQMPPWSAARQLLYVPVEPFKQKVVEVVATAVTLSNPGSFSGDFLKFVNEFRPNIKVHWPSNFSKLIISINIPGIKTEVASRGPLSGPVSNWIREETISRSYDKAIQETEDESASSILQQLTNKLSRAA